MRPDQAITGLLKTYGIEATLSEPGHIAKQMLEHLGGLWDVHLLADLNTLTLLNKMAGATRRTSNEDDTLEENFGLKTVPLKEWVDLIAKRKQHRSLRSINLEDFTERNIVRLGLETDCNNCHAKNWSSLTEIDYQVTCEQCLKTYDFPQASLRKQNRNWTYRVVGPFSIRDYGLGSYSSLLTLRVLERYSLSMDDLDFATAMKLRFDGIEKEVDFIALHAEERNHNHQQSPKLVIGETKSAGRGQLVTSKDISTLKTVASKLNEAIIVVSVLRDHFTPDEKKLLKRLVEWGRRVNMYGEPTYPVLLLTSNELTMASDLTMTWNSIGGKHAEFTGFEHTRKLSNFADSTQQIYLDMPSFSQARNEYWKELHTRRAEKSKREGKK